MQYVIVQFADAVVAYRECGSDGRIYRYADADGNTLPRMDTPREVIDSSPPFPAWGLPDPEPELPPEPEPVAPAVMSKIGFLARFTPEELVGIYTAAKTVVQLEVYIDKIRMAEEVDLTFPETVEGVNALESFGLLAPGRAAEILAP